MNWLLDLKIKYCGHKDLGCHYNIHSCPVVKALDNFNKKYPNNEINWCPKCDGIFKGMKKTATGKEIADYKGGLIDTYGTKEHTKHYRFAFACDCECGKAQQRALNISPYIFGEYKDDCYALYNHRFVEHRSITGIGDKKEGHISTKFDKYVEDLKKKYGHQKLEEHEEIESPF